MIDAKAAWRLARRIFCEMDEEMLQEIFGTEEVEDILLKDVEKVKETLTAWDEKQGFQEGDIVYCKNDETDIVYVVDVFADQFEGIDLYDGSASYSLRQKDYEKTGCSYPKTALLHTLRSAATSFKNDWRD